MIPLLISLIPLALADSGSTIRLAVLAALLASRRRPVLCGLMYAAGFFTIYMVLCILLLTVFKGGANKFGDSFIRWFNHPTALEYALSIVLGLILLACAYWVSRPKEPSGDGKLRGAATEDLPGQENGKMSPVKAFLVGFGTNAIPSPGMLPTVAAMGHLQKSDLSTVETTFVVIYYNLVVVAPFVGLSIVRMVNKEACDRIFEGIRSFLAKWGRRLLAWSFVFVGVLMLADGIGYFFGYPLIPTAK